MTMLGASPYERPAHDAYWTEPWVTEWLLGSVSLVAPGFSGVVWEPACGTGTMVEVLKARGYDVLATDIVDYGYPGMQGVMDFFAVGRVDPMICAIITNPPYSQAEAFSRHALKLMAPRAERAGGMVCLLLRNEYDCAAGRRSLFDRYPFAGKYVLTRRPRWVEERKASPRHNYAWFVWDYQHDAAPVFRLLPASEGRALERS